MKRLFNIVNLFIVAALLSVNTVNAQLTLDCESGNRAIEQGNCWGFGAVSYTNTSTLIISGSWSTRSNSMSNPALGSSWIKSPWMKVGQGNITISTRLENATGTTKQLVASYIPFDVNAGNSKEGTLTTFYTFDFPKNGSTFSLSVQNLVIPIPEAIANSSDIYKIMLSFVGTGGNNRAIADNLIIPGTYWSDPANSCLPLSMIVDTDKDGVADADDKYPTDNTRAYDNYFPSENTFGTLAFEDTWPSKGDYDLNDIVVDYKINRVTNAANNVVEVIATFVAKASGAGYRNAFGFQLDNIEPNKIVSVTGNKVGTVANVFNFGSNGLESNQQYANIIVFDNFYEVVKHPGSGSFINVTKDAPNVDKVQLTVTIKMQSNISINDLPADKFNFYIVADVLKKGRGNEIHLPDGKPSSLVNSNLFGTFDDNSAGAKYYRTENNLPWGINVVQGFDYMFEKISIDKGYNYFINWAESSGTQYPDWFEDKPGYRNPENIYK
jgi:LruC domain-containing protein